MIDVGLHTVLKPHAIKCLRGHWVTRCHQRSLGRQANQISTFKKTLRGLNNPKSSCLLSWIWKLRRMRDRNNLTAVIYLPYDQVLNYARGTQWNSFDTSLHCWGEEGVAQSTQGELIFFSSHGWHMWSPSTAPEHSDSSKPPLKHGHCTCATCFNVTKAHNAFFSPT